MPNMTCRGCGFVRTSRVEDAQATICPRCLERSGGALSIVLEAPKNLAKRSRRRQPLARILHPRPRRVTESTTPRALSEPSEGGATVEARS